MYDGSFGNDVLEYDKTKHDKAFTQTRSTDDGKKNNETATASPKPTETKTTTRKELTTK